MRVNNRHRKHPSATPRFEEIVAPSKITHLHVQDNELSKVAGAPKGWRKLTVLQKAYFTERLGPLKSNEALDRLAAGDQYTKLWDSSQKGSRDSTANLDAGRCVGSGGSLNEAGQAALARIEAIDRHLGGNDRLIVRNVCALGYSIAEAIGALGLPRDTRVSARFCEALDALRDAIDRTEKRGRRS